MAWNKGVPRTEQEKRNISKGLKTLYAQPTEFVRVRNKFRYENAYRYEDRTGYVLKRINESDMPEENKRTLTGYRKHLSLYSDPGNVYNNLRVIFRFFKDFRKTFDKLTEEDALRLFSNCMKQKLSCYTQFTEIGRLKQFLTWLNNGEAPAYLKKMKVRKKLAVQKNVSLSDVQKFIDACESPEEKAFFALLWEGCFSASELLKVKHRDVNVREDMAEIYVESKDRNRIVPILREKGKMFPLGSYELLLTHLKRIRKPKPQDCIWSMEAWASLYKVALLQEVPGHL
jgi:hypothetical protein